MSNDSTGRLWSAAKRRRIGVKHMDCQFNQLAGAPIGIPVRPEAHACIASDICGGPKSVAIVGVILEAFSSVLAAEEVLLGAALHRPAIRLQEAVEVIRSVAREAIETAIAAPGDAVARIALLGHAVDLEGANSALVARCAMALSDTISPAASARSA